MWHSSYSYRQDNDFERSGSGYSHHSSYSEYDSGYDRGGDYDRERYDDYGHHRHHHDSYRWDGDYGHGCHDSIVIFH